MSLGSSTWRRMRESSAIWSYAFLPVINIALGAVIHNGQSHIIQFPSSHLPALDIEPPGTSTNLTRSGNDINTFSSITPMNDDYHFDCDGRKYGFGLDIDDCLAALLTIRRDVHQITFSDRTNPTAHSDAQLPWRWMGGTFSSFERRLCFNDWRCC